MGPDLDALVSVIMPTFEQAAFLPRAVASVLAQVEARWELVVVDDGSCDDTAGAVHPFLDDGRIRYERLPTNRGLGAAANHGLQRTMAPLVAYLPSDDRWDPEHLTRLLAVLAPEVSLAWSGVRHHGTAEALDGPDGFGLQPVQVLHRRTVDRWVERDELETDDLEVLLWGALRRRGRTARTATVTCAWTDHPDQRHKTIRERFDGGLNVFRRRYHVQHPLRFCSSDGWPVDEVELYERFRSPPPPSDDGLRILVVGELGFNPERLAALEERGHQLFGLWTEDGLGSQAVGPLPFGNVTDLPNGSQMVTLRLLLAWGHGSGRSSDSRPGLHQGLFAFIS